jgi:NAD(P)-dependent dehydrogenase (short-subunit alcohol dehydrogenase family)
MSFVGRHVLVTGGGSGIGRATCEQLADAGAHVTVVDIDAGAAETVARATRGTAVVADLTDVKAAVVAIAERVEVLDGLVSAAGIVESTGFPESRVDEWERVLRLNLEAPHFLVQGLLARLRRPGAAIVNVTSVSAKTVLATSGIVTAGYGASKAGLELASRSLAHELAPLGLRVNTVAPGYVETPLSGAHLGEHGESVRAQIPVGRVGAPAEIAAAVLFLLSDSASYITGAQLVVDGGLTLSSAQRLP